MRAFAAGRPLVAILNSRQSKRPCARDSWVGATVQAVNDAVSQGCVVIASTGLNTWELVLALAGRQGGPVIVVTADTASSESTRRSFGIASSKSLFVPIAGSVDRSDFEHTRDRQVIELADRLVPVSIRRGGFLEQVIAEAHGRGKVIDERFRVAYAPGVDHPQYDLANLKVNSALSNQNGHYITHWTRSHHGPYAWERAIEYYSDVSASNNYPRSAPANLKRVLSEQRIRASDRFIREHRSVVAFTAAAPSDALRLMRWRRRYVYYNFEPYGIAIRRDVAQTMGVRPVIYGSDADYSLLREEDRPLFQSRGSGPADWTPESEWRMIGDCDLLQLGDDEAIVIVYRPEEVAEFQAVTRFPVVPLVG